MGIETQQLPILNKFHQSLLQRTKKLACFLLSHTKYYFSIILAFWSTSKTILKLTPVWLCLSWFFPGIILIIITVRNAWLSTTYKRLFTEAKSSYGSIDFVGIVGQRLAWGEGWFKINYLNTVSFRCYVSTRFDNTKGHKNLGVPFKQANFICVKKQKEKLYSKNPTLKYWGFYYTTGRKMLRKLPRIF